MIYVVSDLHGNQTKFSQLLREISFKDTDVMYVVGDVVDYGEENMELIGDLSVRYNVYPILGDHDLRAARMLKGFEKMLKEGTAQPDPAYISEMMEWMQDGGKPTLDGYRALDAEMREGVLEYLEDMALYEEVTVKGKKYLLVHAGIACDGESPTLDALDSLPPEAFVTQPLDPARPLFSDVTIICGHTPTQNGKIGYGNGSIQIDCGIEEHGKIGCLCLNNGREYYV